MDAFKGKFTRTEAVQYEEFLKVGLRVSVFILVEKM